MVSHPLEQNEKGWTIGTALFSTLECFGNIFLSETFLYCRTGNVCEIFN
jgi:hypothetical protein